MSAPRITALVAGIMAIVATIIEVIMAIGARITAVIGARIMAVVGMAIIGASRALPLPGLGPQSRITTMTVWPTACAGSGHMTL
jgi:hypothetical protein